MYVRWQSRERRHRAFGRSGGPDVHWRAVLVESKRIKGKPTQQHIAYLAGFTESALKIPAQQSFIWKRIEAQLRQLGDRISLDDEKRIKAVLIEKIGKPPTKRERIALERRRREQLGAEWCDAHPEGSHL
jgi:hypothetical protein